MDSFHPLNKMAWRKWLQKNHLTKDSTWLIITKKSAPKPNLDWNEAVDVALCFGWIDSVKKSIDDEKYMQYFSKRKPKSTWSKINKAKVTHLIENGLMEDAGYKSIEIAKENGSWTILDEVEACIIPKDLEEEFARYQGAMEYFENLSKSAKKGLLHWVTFAKKKETRQKRISEIAKNASKNTKPKPFR